MITSVITVLCSIHIKMSGMKNIAPYARVFTIKGFFMHRSSVLPN